MGFGDQTQESELTLVRSIHEHRGELAILLDQLPSSAHVIGREFLLCVRSVFSEADQLRIERSLSVAAEGHRDQRRADGSGYILHPIRVAYSLVREFNIHDPDLCCAAILHDTLEDTNIQSERIGSIAGLRVLSIVRILTRPSPSGADKAQVNIEYFSRLLEAEEGARLVKLADKLDNLRDAHNCPDTGKRKRSWTEVERYYLSICDTLTDRPLAARFSTLLQCEVALLKRATRLGGV